MLYNSPRTVPFCPSPPPHPSLTPKNMLSLTTLLLPLLVLVLPTLQAPAEYPYGTIDAPAAGAAVQPGASFDFAYNPHADYALSSFAIHVWLLTGTATNDPWGQSEKTGHFFGTFDYANYPGKHGRYVCDEACDVCSDVGVC